MGNNCGMTAGNVIRFLAPAVLAAAGVSGSILSGATAPIASAQPCPDVQVLFARGTGEDPGVGPTGQAFVDALRSRVGGRSMDVYPINYPASQEWQTGLDGIRDAGTHVESMAASCPQTKMVLSGYSQGAAVMGFVTSAAVPDGVDPATVPKPLAPDVANHVAAVALFGKPSGQFMSIINEPPVTVGPLYAPKTIDLCVPNDPVCSGSGFPAAHRQYVDVGMVDQAADFAASRL
jgi:cutinase